MATIELLKPVEKGQENAPREVEERWEIREVWWSEAFYPKTFETLLVQGYWNLLGNVGNLIVGMFPFLRMALQRTAEEAGGEKTGVYAPAPVRSLSWVYDFFVGIIALVEMIFWRMPILLLASLAMLASWSAIRMFLPETAQKLFRWAVEDAVNSRETPPAITLTEEAAASVRQRMIDTMQPFLDTTHPSYQKCDSAVVIAHSGGATIAYSVLSYESLWEKWNPGHSDPPVNMTFITVGSSLNLSWGDVKNHPMWGFQLPNNIAWVDLWARYDLVPHGPPNREVVESLRGSTEQKEGFFNVVRVVNHDSVFSDHDYWWNLEEVTSRLIYEIGGRPQAGKLREAVNDAVYNIGGHRRKIGQINVARLLAGAGVLVVSFFTGFLQTVGSAVLNSMPAQIKSQDPFPTIGNILDFFPSEAGAVLVGFIAVLLGLYMVWRFIRVWFSGTLYMSPWSKLDCGKEPTRSA